MKYTAEEVREAAATNEHPIPLRVRDMLTAYAESMERAQADESSALAHFTDYFVRNYPGPETIISNPNWHAPKIFRAAQHAIDLAAAAPQPGDQL